MKKIFILILGVASFALTFGQEEDPDKALKQAARNVSIYNLDPAENAGKLEEAKSLIDMVVNHADYRNSSKAWFTYGEVYAELVNQDARALVLNPQHEIAHPNATAEVYEAFKKAYEFGEKNYEKKDAISGLEGILNNMSYLANTILRAGNYELAYHAYDAVVGASDFLKKQGGATPFAEEAALNDQVYLTALAALSAEKMEEASDLFNRLYKANYDNAAVYEGLYKTCSTKGDSSGAAKILAEGREKYPDDKGLLFTWINNALAQGKLEDVVDDLEVAHTKEPDNPSVPATLGNVYSQLAQGESCPEEALMMQDDTTCYYLDDSGDKVVFQGDMCSTNTCFVKASHWYNVALGINPEDFVSLYGLGELHYNLAARYANEANELADDYTPEGTKKWEAKKAQMMGQFDEALPYFLKADEINSTDMNTLIALREIYVRKDMIEKSNEYKVRIEEISGGSQ